MTTAAERGRSGPGIRTSSGEGRGAGERGREARRGGEERRGIGREARREREDGQRDRGAVDQRVRDLREREAERARAVRRRVAATGARRDGGCGAVRGRAHGGGVVVAAEMA